jgi:DNA-binding XRE family transcriptional regulator
MNAKEQEDVIRTAAVIRTARKLRGKTQIDVANHLGVSQSFLSKLEHGRLIPSSSQWFLFCRMTGINPASTFDSGFIDHSLSIVQGNPYPHSIFKLNSKYSNHTASKVRSTRLFIQYFNEQAGENKFDKFCEEKGNDPDFFRVLDHQINFAFTVDLVTAMIKKGFLTFKDLPDLVRPITEPNIHGLLHQHYDKMKDPLQLIECLIQNKEKYEANFKYQVEDRHSDGIVLGVSPNPVVEQFDYKSSVLGDFFCKYSQQYLQHFTTYGGRSQPVQIEERQCHYQGHDRCVYEIRGAA